MNGPDEIYCTVKYTGSRSTVDTWLSRRKWELYNVIYYENRKGIFVSSRSMQLVSDYESPKAQKEAERIHGAPRVKVIIKK